ncbi:MAG: hypothetical protein IT292_09950 [Deltaproteobacteria bacterium]|nr:hypothetical protein [Deltaproteobacteria bacterium]
MLENPADYDFIIRTRFDLKMCNPFPWKLFLGSKRLRGSLCFTEMLQYGFDTLNCQVCDPIAIANPYYMDIYSSLYDEMMNNTYAHLYEATKPELSSEFLLAWHLRTNHVPTVVLPFNFQIVRQENLAQTASYIETNNFIKEWRASNPIK